MFGVHDGESKKFTLQRETVSGRTLNINISLVKRKSKVGNFFWLQIADGATSKKWRFFMKKKSNQYKVTDKFFRVLKDRGFYIKNIDVLV